MNITDYLFGQPITLRSPLSAGEAAARINEAAKSRWWPLHFGQPVGGVRRGRITLRYASSPMEYNAKPILVGRIDDCGGRSVLDLSYRGARISAVFFAVWYLLLFIFIALSYTLGPDPDVTDQDRWVPFLVFPVLLLFPLLLHFIGTRNSESELQLLLDFLEETIQAS